MSNRVSLRDQINFGGGDMLPVAQLFQKVFLKMQGPVFWLTPVPETSSGVYVVALADPHTIVDVAENLRERWNPGQEIIYIGRATCIGKRVRQFYRHLHGTPRPHRGGQDIKLLGTQLLVYWGATEAFPEVEDRMIEEFKSAVGRLPFGNKIKAARRKLSPADAQLIY